MIQESDATRAAYALIDQFGQQATDVAARRAESCDASGRGESAKIWRAIQGVVEQIEREQLARMRRESATVVSRMAH